MDQDRDRSPADGQPESLTDLLKGVRSFFAEAGRRAGAAEGATGGASPGREALLRRLRRFDLTPRDIRDYLDRFVISQDEAKRVLSVALCDHYHHVRRCLEKAEAARSDYAKHNVLLLGPTGVGKTYLMRCAARLIGVPLAKADATKFSETGYVGYDVEDIVRDLVRMADNDPEVAQYGIVYIDEVDKIASRVQDGGRDVSGRGVQTNLLKLMEDTDVRLVGQTDMLGQMQAMVSFQVHGEMPQRTISTRHVLFIVSGAFDRLPELVRRRLGKTQIGFDRPGDMDPDDRSGWMRRTETRDLVEFGFEPEFAGRLPVRVALGELTAADLEQILGSAEESILKQYREDLAGYGIELEVTPKGLHEVAVRAHAEGTGARGLMTILERTFRDAKFELPSARVRRLVLTAELVREPARVVAELARQGAARTPPVPPVPPPQAGAAPPGPAAPDPAAPEESGPDPRDLGPAYLADQVGYTDVDVAAATAEAAVFAALFAQEHGIQVTFTQAAVEFLLRLARDRRVSVQQVCQGRFRNLGHALRLLERHTGRTQFTVTLPIARDPDYELSRRIRESTGRGRD